MNFSRRKLAQPGPPLPERIWTLARSRNFMNGLRNSVKAGQGVLGVAPAFGLSNHRTTSGQMQKGDRRARRSPRFLARPDRGRAFYSAASGAGRTEMKVRPFTPFRNCT